MQLVGVSVLKCIYHIWWHVLLNSATICISSYNNIIFNLICETPKYQSDATTICICNSSDEL